MNDVLRAIREKNEYEERLTEYMQALKKRANREKTELFGKIRAFQNETVYKHDIFYVDEMTQMMIPEFLEELKELGVISETNNKPIFNKRWVLPIKNSEGMTQNFVGYSPYAEERYIYGTSRYYRRRDTLFGLENINIAYEMGYAFLTEGITDTIRLRDLGFENSFAMCGTHNSDVIKTQLNRCRYGVIMVPDRDKAGLSAHKHWLDGVNRSVTIMINHRYKDVDEMCANGEEQRTLNEENITYFKECAEASIQWIKQMEHKGARCGNEKLTML